MHGGKRCGGAVAGVLAAVIVMIGATAACEPPPPGEGTFRALTYNVAGLPEPLSGSEPDINTPLISPKLNAYDLVLVQEDWIDPVPPVPSLNFHHDDLISQVTHPYLTTPDPTPIASDPRGKGALVSDGLNLISRIPLGTPTRVMWDDCFGGADQSDGGAGDCLATKGFMLTTITLAEGTWVDVYDLHGEAGGTATDQALQAADYQQLAAFIQVYSRGRPIILGGDTNLHTDGTHPDASGLADRTIWRNFLAATGLHDVCETVACGAAGDSIDKFASRSGGGVRITPRSHRFENDVFVRDDGARLSDHNALAVTFDWSTLPV